MTVKTAKKFVVDIQRVCEQMLAFQEKHPELDEETGFMVDAAGLLGDYKKLLNKGIEDAELRF